MKRVTAIAKEKLLQRKAMLAHLYERGTEETEELRAERETDFPDKAAVAEATTVLSTLTDRERIELEAIEIALRRIAAGNYGYCERCDGAIGRQRLLAVPETNLCFACSDQRAANVA
jgi:DnaK suppressor protein